MWNVNAQVPRRRHSWNLPKPLLLRTARSCRTKSAVLYVRCHQTSGPSEITWWNEVWVVLEKESDIQRVVYYLTSTERTYEQLGSSTADKIYTLLLTGWGVVTCYAEENASTELWYSIASRNSSSWTLCSQNPTLPPPSQKVSAMYSIELWYQRSQVLGVRIIIHYARSLSNIAGSSLYINGLVFF